jgi:hypothetical protein
MPGGADPDPTLPTQTRRKRPRRETVCAGPGGFRPIRAGKRACRAGEEVVAWLRVQVEGAGRSGTRTGPENVAFGGPEGAQRGIEATAAG